MRDVAKPLAYTIEGAVQASGATRSRLFELIAQGALDARRAGKQTLILADSLEAYLKSLPRAEPRQRAPQHQAAA